MTDESSPQEREAERMAGALAMPEPHLPTTMGDFMGTVIGSHPGAVAVSGVAIFPDDEPAPPSGEPWLAIKWQEGPIREVGVNGVQMEDVIDVLVARLEGFQAGEFACEENAEALMYLRQAKRQLDQRTARRRAQGVEGLNLPHGS